MQRTLWLLAATLSACGADDAEPSFTSIAGPENRVVGDVVGTSLDDLWASVATGIANATELQHYDGTSWSRVPLALNGQSIQQGRLAAAGTGSVFVAGAVGVQGVVVRVDTAGTVVDHTSEVPPFTAQDEAEIRGGRGGVLVRISKSHTFSLAASGTLAMIPEPPTADASLSYAAGPGDGYFVKGQVPSVVHHFHDGAWDTLPFTNFPAFSGVGTSATDVWLSYDGGLKGGHGDGQLATWSEYEVTAAPTDSGLVEYTMISLVSTGVGHVGVVGQRRDTDSGGDKVQAMLWHLDTKFKVVREELLASGRCTEVDAPRCPGAGAGGLAQLEDGSVIFKFETGPGTESTYYVGRPHD